MAVDVKQISKGVLEEAFGKGNLDYVDQVTDPSCKFHDALLGDVDVETFKRSIAGYRAAFPDLKGTLLAICAEGDLVAMHWRFTGTHEGPIQGAPPTGKRVTVEGMSFDRFRGGKIVESTGQWDTLGFLQQLGIVPQMEASAVSREAPRPHAER